jgi:DivIVA domain-containing protein
VFILELLAGIIVVLAAAVVLAAVGSGLPPARPDAAEPALPSDRLLASADIPGLRFRTAVRGYRMEDVDAALAAIHAALWAAEQAAPAARRAPAGQTAPEAAE